MRSALCAVRLATISYAPSGCLITGRGPCVCGVDRTARARATTLRAGGASTIADPLDLAIAHFINELGRGVIDPFHTDLVCAVPLLLALWVALVLLALRLDRKGGRLVAGTVLLAVALHFLISEACSAQAPGARRAAHACPPLPRPPRSHRARGPPLHRLVVSVEPRREHGGHRHRRCCLLLGYAYRRFAAAGALVATVMCFSRVHNGMHYPTDVLTGTVLGVGYAFLAIRLAAAIARRSSRRAAAGVAAG